MKTYKTWEAIKMLEENNKMIFVCETEFDEKHELHCEDGYIHIRTFDKTNQIVRNTLDGDFNTNYKWTIKQQPVTFQEVLSSNKKCRVEHSLINTNEPILNVPYVMESEWELYCNGKYLKFGDLMNILGYKYTHGLQDIIKNGKWYLEEEI